MVDGEARFACDKCLKDPTSFLSLSLMPEPISHRRRKRQRGSAIVEFGLTLVPLLALLFLTLDLAWMLFAWACIQEGVREGVRFAITGQSSAKIVALVQQRSFGIIKSSSQVQLGYYSPSNPGQSLPNPPSACSGDIVKIAVTGVSITPLAPLWHSKSPISLSGAAADLVEPTSTCTP